jgi:hypothetical protein
MTGVTTLTRRLVLERDGASCVSCGRPVDVSAGRYSLHHRVARGMGGSKAPWINLPANLLTLCGSGTTACHGWTEFGNRQQAYEWGYLIRRGSGTALQLPESVKVLTHTGWVLFDNDGGVTSVPLPNWSPDRQREFDAYVARARDTRMGVAA